MRGRPKTIDWTTGFRVCPTCREKGPQPLDNFRRDKARPNGRVSQCKACLSSKGNAEERRAVRELQFPRKPCLKSVNKIKALTMVKQVIRQPRTREEIEQITGYHEDIVSAVLANLWDAGQAKVDRESRRFVAA